MTAHLGSRRPILPNGLSLPSVTALLFVAVGTTWQVARPSDLTRLVTNPGGAAPAPISAAAPSFVPRGDGAIVKTTGLYSAPSGGEFLRDLAPGTMVTVGGRVSVQAGLLHRDIYWVRPVGAESATYGFVPADSVALPGLTPPKLDLTGYAPQQLLAPQEGLQYAATGAGAGAVPDPAVENADAGSVAAMLANGITGLFGASAPSAAGTRTAAATDLSASSIGAEASSSSRSIQIPWLPDSLARWHDLLIEAGSRHQIDPELLAIITLVESGGNPNAVSGSGALGLMQVMPTTGTDIARRRGIAGFSADQLRDPATNVDFGAWYLAEQMKAFAKSDDPDWAATVNLAAAAYNGGPGSVQRYLTGGTLPAEAERYRTWVGGMWRERHDPQSPTLTSWLQAGGARLVATAAAGN